MADQTRAPAPGDDVVETLTNMLAAAKAGKLDHLAYHYQVGDQTTWGFWNVSQYGQLLIPAQLAAMAIAKEEG